MDDKQRTQRLLHTLTGTGATVNGPYQVWAVGGTVTDAYLFALAEWADRTHLVLSGCPITTEALHAISRFHRLELLDIGGTSVTSGYRYPIDGSHNVAALNRTAHVPSIRRRRV